MSTYIIDPLHHVHELNDQQKYECNAALENGADYLQYPTKESAELSLAAFRLGGYTVLDGNVHFLTNTDKNTEYSGALITDSGHSVRLPYVQAFRMKSDATRAAVWSTQMHSDEELEEAADVELEEAADVELEEAADVELEEAAADVELKEAVADVELEEAADVELEEAAADVELEKAAADVELKEAAADKKPEVNGETTKNITSTIDKVEQQMGGNISSPHDSISEETDPTTNNELYTLLHTSISSFDASTEEGLMYIQETLQKIDNMLKTVFDESLKNALTNIKVNLWARYYATLRVSPTPLVVPSLYKLQKHMQQKQWKRVNAAHAHAWPRLSPPIDISFEVKDQQKSTHHAVKVSVHATSAYVTPFATLLRSTKTPFAEIEAVWIHQSPPSCNWRPLSEQVQALLRCLQTPSACALTTPVPLSQLHCVNVLHITRFYLAANDRTKLFKSMLTPVEKQHVQLFGKKLLCALLQYLLKAQQLDPERTLITLSASSSLYQKQPSARAAPSMLKSIDQAYAYEEEQFYQNLPSEKAALFVSVLPFVDATFLPSYKNLLGNTNDDDTIRLFLKEHFSHTRSLAKSNTNDTLSKDSSSKAVNYYQQRYGFVPLTFYAANVPMVGLFQHVLKMCCATK